MYEARRAHLWPLINLLQETLESRSCGRSFPRLLRGPLRLVLVHCRSIRIICGSICAKAHGTHSVRSRVTSSHLLLSLLLWRLRHDAKDGVVAADAGPNLLVVFLGVTHLVKLRLPKQIIRMRWLGRTTLRATKISLNIVATHKKALSRVSG